MEALIGLLVIVLILGLVWYAMSAVPLPQPARIAVTVIFCIIAILLLLGQIGYGPHLSLR